MDALTTRLIAQHGTVENALRHLVTASITTDTELNTLRGQVNDYKAKLPDGSIVLTKEAAANWTKLQALNLTPEQIEAAVKKLPTVEGELSKRDLEKLARAAATAGQVDPDGFAAHVASKGLAVELRDATVTEHGKQVVKKVPFVKVASDDKAQPVALSDYMAKLPAFEQRALKATGTPVATVTPAHSQQPTPTGAHLTGDPVAEYMNKRFAPRQPAGAAAS